MLAAGIGANGEVPDTNPEHKPTQRTAFPLCKPLLQPQHPDTEPQPSPAGAARAEGTGSPRLPERVSWGQVGNLLHAVALQSPGGSRAAELKLSYWKRPNGLSQFCCN